MIMASKGELHQGLILFGLCWFVVHISPNYKNTSIVIPINCSYPKATRKKAQPQHETPLLRGAEKGKNRAYCQMKS